MSSSLKQQRKDTRIGGQCSIRQASKKQPFRIPSKTIEVYNTKEFDNRQVKKLHTVSVVHSSQVPAEPNTQTTC